MRLLVVSDDDDLRTTVVTGLRLVAGWDAVGADQRSAHREMASTPDFDGILLDIVILSTGGPSRAYLVWADATTRLPPIILLTAHSEACVGLASARIPVVGILQKPMDIATLGQRIAALLSDGRVNPAIRSS